MLRKVLFATYGNISLKKFGAWSFRPGGARQLLPSTDLRLLFAHLLDLPLYAFIASIPFETVGATGQGVEPMSLTISRVLGLVWAASCAINPSISLRRMHRSVAAMLLFIGIFSTRSLPVDSELLPTVANSILMLVQMVGMAWLIINTVSSRPKMYERIAWTFAISCAVLAVLQIVGLTTTEIMEGRVTALGEDPNIICGKLSVGVVLMTGLAWSRARSSGLPMLVAAVGCPLIIVAILRTGSRGGMLAMAVGLVVLVWPSIMLSGGVLRIIRALTLAAAASALIYAITTTSVLTNRWDRTLESGDMAERELLYPQTLEMVATNPVLGWGPAQNSQELAGRMHDNSAARSTENTFIWAFTAVGLLGSLPFLYFVYCAVRSVWRVRRTSLGWTPFAALITMLLAACTVECQHNKVFWLMLGMSVAIGVIAQRKVTTASFRLNAARPQVMAAP
jgi:hypothetical protein